MNVTDIHPLTGFLRDHKAYIERLQETGRPEVLTVNGRAKVVVQDAAAYQRLVEEFERLDTERILRDRLNEMRTGTTGVPASELLSEVREILDVKHR